MLLLRKGPTSHLPLHDDDDDNDNDDTIEIPPTEILGRIFTTIVVPVLYLLQSFFILGEQNR
jgi:hypothetical protein